MKNDKLKSNKGIFLSLIAYPLLTLMVAFCMITFVAAVNSNNLIRIQMKDLQSQYQAIRGIEYALTEIKNHTFGGNQFLTQVVQNDALCGQTGHPACSDNNNLSAIGSPPTITIATSTTIIANGVFTDRLNAVVDGFEVKTYKKGNDLYILSRGTANDKSRLFASKLSGSSFYDYFFFFPRGSTFENTTIDAQGGKIHSNGDIVLGENARLSNVRELSAASGIGLASKSSVNIDYAHLTNDGTAAYSSNLMNVANYFFGQRYPNWLPSGGKCGNSTSGNNSGCAWNSNWNNPISNANPPDPLFISPYNDWQFHTIDSLAHINLTPGTYRNSPDGHYAGDSYGLLYASASTAVPWAGQTNDGGYGYPGSAGGYGPIAPSTWETGPIAGVPQRWEFDYSTSDPNDTRPVTVKWDPSSASRAAVYYNKFPNNCLQGANANCINDIYDNYSTWFSKNNLLSDALPQINGVKIPNRLYRAPRVNGENITNSNNYPLLWSEFVNSPSFGVAIDNATGTITGIAPNGTEAGVIKAGTAGGASYVIPPSISVSSLAYAARNSNSGMSIQKIVDPADITKKVYQITINGVVKGTIPVEPNVQASSPITCNGSPVFTRRSFMNAHQGSGLQVVDIDIGNLMACDAGNAVEARQWLPKNGIIYVDTGGLINDGVVISNAKTLPAGGLTTVVTGKLILKGEYNNPTNPQDWQPSAGFTTSYTYLVSDAFNWPPTLPVPQHQPNYPYPWTTPNGLTLQGSGIDADYAAQTAVSGSGYNWAYHHDTNSAGAGNYRMANRAAPPSGSDTVVYNISLVGRHGFEPEFLERWSYYDNVGNDTTPPSNPTYIKAAVTGSFVGLTDKEFCVGFQGTVSECDAVLEEITMEERIYGCYDISQPYHYPPLNIDGSRVMGSSADSSTSTGYPCRTTGWAWAPISDNFVQWPVTVSKKYERNFITTANRPPGNFLGFTEAALIELDNTPSSWTKHNTSVFQ